MCVVDEQILVNFLQVSTTVTSFKLDWQGAVLTVLNILGMFLDSAMLMHAMLEQLTVVSLLHIFDIFSIIKLSIAKFEVWIHRLALRYGNRQRLLRLLMRI